MADATDRTLGTRDSRPTPTAHMARVHALQDVDAEMDRAIRLHGPLPTDPVRAWLILAEEYGEVSEGVLKYTRPEGATATNAQHLRDELIQVAAVCIRWAAVIGRR